MRRKDVKRKVCKERGEEGTRLKVRFLSATAASSSALHRRAASTSPTPVLSLRRSPAHVSQSAAAGCRAVARSCNTAPAGLHSGAQPGKNRPFSSKKGPVFAAWQLASPVLPAGPWLVPRQSPGELPGMSAPTQHGHQALPKEREQRRRLRQRQGGRERSHPQPPDLGRVLGYQPDRPHRLRRAQEPEQRGPAVHRPGPHSTQQRLRHH